MLGRIEIEAHDVRHLRLAGSRLTVVRPDQVWLEAVSRSRSEMQPLVRPTVFPSKRVVQRLRPGGGGDMARRTARSTSSGGTAWSRRPGLGRSTILATPSPRNRERSLDTFCGVPPRRRANDEKGPAASDGRATIASSASRCHRRRCHEHRTSCHEALLHMDGGALAPGGQSGGGAPSGRRQVVLLCAKVVSLEPRSALSPRQAHSTRCSARICCMRRAQSAWLRLARSLQTAGHGS